MWERLGRLRECGEQGNSLIEVAVAMAVLAIVGTGSSAMLVTSTGSNRGNLEGVLAAEATLGVLDELRALPRAEVFARYNAFTGDDPATGVSPGASFDVAGLSATADDPDGRVGTIEFPGDGTLLIEDVDMRELGMPRDLNGDTLVDEADHALDYVALPVRVSVTYLGRNGPRTTSFVTML